MEVLLSQRKTALEDCPYISGPKSSNLYFLARNVSSEELEGLLSTGWRKFGPTYFKVNCPHCKACTPIRIVVNDFSPSKGQRRILKKNKDLIIKIKAPEYNDEIFSIYEKHSEMKFNQKVSKDEFLITHFYNSTTSFQMEYYLKNRLLAIGFLDASHQALNSVYFIYDPEFSKRSLGRLGVLKEVELAQQLNLKYYYLGYFIEENDSMSYKKDFKPHEYYDWGNEFWTKEYPLTCRTMPKFT